MSITPIAYNLLGTYDNRVRGSIKGLERITPSSFNEITPLSLLFFVSIIKFPKGTATLLPFLLILRLIFSLLIYKIKYLLNTYKVCK